MSVSEECRLSGGYMTDNWTDRQLPEGDEVFLKRAAFGITIPEAIEAPKLSTLASRISDESTLGTSLHYLP